jgi:6-phosphogluconolactonase
MSASPTSQRPELVVASDLPAIGDVTARLVCELAVAAVAAHGRFTNALSGGKTPEALFDALAERYRDAVPWDRTHVFWSDERAVPPTSGDSNYKLAADHLLSRVPVPPENVHRILAEGGAARAAAAYEAELRAFFAAKPPASPRFDLMLLGIGEDGHTASLFPGTAALQASGTSVVANHVTKLGVDRITMTYPVLNAAACVVVLACGAAKAPVVRRVFGAGRGDDAGGPPLPIQGISPKAGRYVWITDTAAASTV